MGNEKEVKSEKPIKVKRMTKSQFVKQAGISHLNSKEKHSLYLTYIR